MPVLNPSLVGMMMNRLASVDVVRTIAICFVIAIHTTPFERLEPLGAEFDIALVVDQVARFAVPFFFVISGYFWAAKTDNLNAALASTKKSVKRLIFLFLSWSAIYLIPFNLVEAFSFGATGPLKTIYWNLQNLAKHPIALLFEGTKPHLWFLTGLAFSLIGSAIFLKLNRMKLLFGFSVVLYFVGLMGKAYSDAPFGFHVPFNFRDGPFFSLIFFVTGYFLNKKGLPSSGLYIGIATTIVGVAMHLFEIVHINRTWGTTMAQDYVLGTYFMGVGVAMISLSNTRWLNVNWLSSMGPLVLGIYASHYAFVDLLAPLDKIFIDQPLWQVGYVLIVFALAYGVSTSLSKYRTTAKLFK
jgi:surface polysaccharide O-acyltransferase-like enzyme